jgi:hypothetical protein
MEIFLTLFIVIIKKENNKPAGPAERRRAKTQCSMYMLSAPFKYCFEIRAASHSPTASHC